MFHIIRILFCVFIIAQFVLLCTHQFIKIPVTQKGLKWSLGLKITLIVAYAVYVNVHFYPEEITFGVGLFIIQVVLRCMPYLFEILLCVLVWYAFLHHTIDKDKIYQMNNLCIETSNQNTYKVYGVIREGRHDFDVSAQISDEDFMRLSASGYFDAAGAQKTLLVCYRGFINDGSSHAYIEVTPVFVQE